MNGQTEIEYIIINYLNGNITDAEHRALTVWTEQSEKNRQIFDQMREIWLVSEMVDGKFKFDFHAAFEQFKKKTGQSNPQPRRAITMS